MSAEFDQGPLLDRVRELIERAQRIPNLTDTEHRSLKDCWLAHASIEVPRALQQLRSVDPPDQHEPLIAAFLDDMTVLTGRVEEVVNAHDRDAAHQARIAAEECRYTHTLLEIAKTDLQMRSATQDHRESSRF
ncbi:hypothetical protein BKG82_27285 [Mycobacteroides chelonae]|uniref:Uncharacterized protein n=1 Tax=Mycobacteroides chelonae TaxID=1774 RepID=A0A1S1LIX6_MYCCH|nr:hypothetical protein [Mycobacteroides chelonae]OHU47356.1 hypothetical protein BKG82_27285 [Mycobacteroides chelonae]